MPAEWLGGRTVRVDAALRTLTGDAAISGDRGAVGVRIAFEADAVLARQAETTLVGGALEATAVARGVAAQERRKGAWKKGLAVSVVHASDALIRRRIAVIGEAVRALRAVAALRAMVLLQNAHLATIAAEVRGARRWGARFGRSGVCGAVPSARQTRIRLRSRLRHREVNRLLAARKE